MDHVTEEEFLANEAFMETNRIFQKEHSREALEGCCPSRDEYKESFKKCGLNHLNYFYKKVPNMNMEPRIYTKAPFEKPSEASIATYKKFKQYFPLEAKEGKLPSLSDYEEEFSKRGLDYLDFMDEQTLDWCAGGIKDDHDEKNNR